MTKIRSGLIGAVAMCGTALWALGSASAMPVSGLANASDEVATDLQQVRWVCGPFRCWWRPNYYPYYGYAWGGPRFYARPWGWRAGPYWRGRRW